MNRAKVGAKLRIARIRLGLRQIDVARAARVSRQTVSNVERGRFGRTSIEILDRIGSAMGVWFELDVRSRGADLDRLANAAHAALGEQVVRWIGGVVGWTCAAEVSFATTRESGTVDLLAYHATTRHLAVIELKTGLFDINEHLGTLDRKVRLGAEIAAQRGWPADHVSAWLIVADSHTNRRRLHEHRLLVASQLPADGRTLRPWFAKPRCEVRGVAFWPNVSPNGARRDIASRQRVRRAPTPPARASSRSPTGRGS